MGAKWHKSGHYRWSKPKMGRKAYPLRKIVGHQYGNEKGEFKSLIFEVLECGHMQTPRTDFVGETNATRRRCVKCFREINRKD